MKFIDLFSGIGAFRQAVGDKGQCVYSCEIDKFARQTYEANFTIDHPFDFDINDVDYSIVPNHNILFAGFPCQPFSTAVGPHLNTATGDALKYFNNTKELYKHIVSILHYSQPEYALLENVPNLLSKRHINHYNQIKSEIISVGYKVHNKIFSSEGLVPQKRNRVFILCERTDINNNINLNELEISTESGPIMSSILQDNVDDKYTISDKAWAGIQRRKIKKEKNSSGFCYDILYPDSVAYTLLRNYYKDGHSHLVYQEGKNPRRLTERECARLMGFPDSFILPCSRSQTYKQLGNSIVVPVIEKIYDFILERS